MFKTVLIRIGFTVLAVSLSLAIPAALYSADRDALAAALASITKDELKGHVEVLADDTFEGREMGSRGGRAAGNYLVKALEQSGAKPAGEGGTYFQSFNGSSRNLLALVEGSDPQLSQQVVLLGAQYD